MPCEGFQRVERSKRSPSTCMCSTQYLRLSSTMRLTIGWLALGVLPVPV
jgi:hypothetical protein